MCYMSDIAPKSTTQPSTRGRSASSKVYEDIAAAIRRSILTGELRSGDRLPPEKQLADRFGVGRTTVREALRLCAGEQLIETEEGSTGGSFVARPSSMRVSNSLGSSLGMLARAEEVSLEELLEARLLLEVPAARVAAERRTDEDVERLNDASPIELLRLSPTDQFAHNQEFHSVLIETAGNALLSIAAQPIFTVLQRSLGRSRLGADFHSAINEHHREIAAAVAGGDPAAASRHMVHHLEFLRPYYERAWRFARAGERER
jgi:DNA-binding FadR family transcriptional regulator